VVDKLLTGFDEPRNTVLYIDKPLKGHNLIQAVARVNRLHDDKRYGVLVDYRGILKELDTAIRAYQDLETRTQGGFDVADIEGLYRNVRAPSTSACRPARQAVVVLQGRGQQAGPEQFRQVLTPQVREGA
jgi:type I restriction enzyme R subunit